MYIVGGIDMNNYLKLRCERSEDSSFTVGKTYEATYTMVGSCCGEDSYYIIYDNNGSKRYMVLDGYFYSFSKVIDGGGGDELCLGN